MFCWHNIKKYHDIPFVVDIIFLMMLLQKSLHLSAACIWLASQRLCTCVCVCVTDVIKEVSTRLDRQAHLNDRFPQVINSRLSCLRATVPVTDLQVSGSTHDNKPLLQCHRATSAYAVGLALSSVGHCHRYIAYRGTQPHNTESIVTVGMVLVCRQQQSASASTVQCHKNSKNKIEVTRVAEVCILVGTRLFLEYEAHYCGFQSAVGSVRH
mmetsp:Transcript_570/g.832  ORF Transcript_570/g.832 Transcript_570/m.832 type:complete len:211 (-) Transcript_570:207-839(-)